VKLLVDANLSPTVALRLREHGHDAIHVRDRGLQEADDDVILALAIEEDRVIVSEDTDFGALLARRRTLRPSFVLLRTVEPMTPDAQAALLIANLDEIAPSVAGGCIASIGRGHLRIRPLPLRPVADEP
jgi:predicted nuclease of predicted toxin-antitoxin system